VGIAYVVGNFVTVMDSTVATTALPAIARQFHAPTPAASWVVIGYLLSLTMCIPLSAWLADRVGTRATYLGALLLFILASVACGVAPSLGSLVGLRILQGVGGGILVPVGQAMLFRAYPPRERARASAVMMVPTVLAPALGPVVGGLLVVTLSWHWVFYINVPVGILGLAAVTLLREPPPPAAGRFDLGGFALAAAALAGLLYAVSEGPTAGWSNPAILVSGAGGIGAAALLWWWEGRHPRPLVALRLLSDRLFASTNLVGMFGRAGFLAMLFLVPLFLQDARGENALNSGLTTFPEAVGVLLSSRLVARLYVALGPRRLMAGGLGGVALLEAAMSRIGLHTDPWWIRLGMFGIGVGMAFMILSLQAASFARTRSADMGRASAIFNGQRQLASAFGVAVAASVLAVGLRDPSGHLRVGPAEASAFPAAFLAAAAMAAAGALLSLRVRDADAAATMRPRGPSADPAAPTID
jgi:EmrB/QacA subfamily drug resistance transporter